MSLRTLPVGPGLTTDRVRDAYVGELKKVATPEELRAFTTRWKPLYEMTKTRPFNKKAKGAKRPRLSQKNLKRLILGYYDDSIALRCILKCREASCEHASQFACAGAHIVLPMVLADASYVADKYGVTTDLALIQMNGGLGVFEGDDRDE